MAQEADTLVGPSYTVGMRTKFIIAVAILLAVIGGTTAYFVTMAKPAAPMARGDGTFARPMPWNKAEDARTAVIDRQTASITLGTVTVAAPRPPGVKVDWKHASSNAREVLSGSADINGASAKFVWTTAQGNPHTVFTTELEAERAKLTEAIVGSIELPDGELTYVNDALARVPFAGTPIHLSALTRGPIIWRNGEDTLALWQWTADRVSVEPTDSGGVRVTFYWWDPKLHPIREECATQVNAAKVRIDAGVTISFGEVPQFGFGRLPKGVTSAVVPIFVDPQDAKDERFRDGASASAEDYVNRARTIAFGHSSTADARYGNGGLAGLDVGGTITVPPSYDVTAEAFTELSATLAAAAIELTPEDELRPGDCKRLAEALSGGGLVVGEPLAFDGKFPNLFSLNQRNALPGLVGHSAVWRPTALTGQRKDVVTQALSSTYLTRLADVRGLAILEIPIVATRNPLVAVASEALLEPERDGQWTIEESTARALAGVELLSEDDRFDFVGIRRFADYTSAITRVEIGQVTPGSWRVVNRGQTLDGFTLVFDHEVSITVDGEPIQTALRTLGNGARQTWAWWDLAEGAPYELEIEGDIAPGAVEWTTAK